MEAGKNQKIGKEKTFLIDSKILHVLDKLKEFKIIFTDAEFAESIGLKKQNLYKIRSKQTHFTVYQINLICHIYNINPAYLFSLSTNMFRNKSAMQKDNVKSFFSQVPNFNDL